VVRVGLRKLHVRKRRREITALYDLVPDRGSRRRPAAQHPAVVARSGASHG